MSNKIRYLLPTILTITFLLRFFAISHGIGIHPDERGIIMMTERLSWSNPAPDSFAYGSLPFYLLKGFSEALALLWPGASSYEGLFIVGRSLNALFSLWLVLATFRLAMTLFKEYRAAYWAAFLVGTNTFIFQNSHFFTVDTLLTVLTTETLIYLCRISEHVGSRNGTQSDGVWRDYIFASVLIGAALATKIGALTLLAPSALAFFLHKGKTFKDIRYPVVSSFIILSIFTLAEPFAFSWTGWLNIIQCSVSSDCTVLSQIFSEKFLRDIFGEITMVRGTTDPRPYTVQYQATIPYLYPVSEMIRNCLGTFSSFLIILGFITQLFFLHSRHRLVPLFWGVLFFLTVAGSYVKFPRYLLPLYPLLFCYAANFLSFANSALLTIPRRGSLHEPLSLVNLIKYLSPVRGIKNFAQWLSNIFIKIGLIRTTVKSPYHKTLIQLKTRAESGFSKGHLQIYSGDNFYLRPNYTSALYLKKLGFGALVTTSSTPVTILFTLTITIPLLLRAFVFSSIYSVPHPYELASRWVYENISPKSTILGVHWDDKLPIDLPGFSGSQFNMWLPEHEIAIYESDSNQKITNLLSQVASADYIIFPSAKIPASVTRWPARYPFSANFLKGLFDNQLGYSLEKTVKNYPKLGGWLFNNRIIPGLNYDDDLSDESLTLYDHPKVFIFKNNLRYSAEELFSIIKSHPELKAEKYNIDETVREIQSAKGSVGKDLPSYQTYTLGSVLSWLIIIELLAWIIHYPLNRYIGLSGRCASFAARPAAFFLFFGAFWWLNSLHLAASNTQSLWLFAIACVVGRILISPNDNSKVGSTFNGLSLFLIPFLTILFLRSMQSEIFWGEKPMDFSFLSYFYRETKLPPTDPWAFGNTMRYYYLGSYLFAQMGKMSGVAPGVAYNLAIATIGAFLICAIASVIDAAYSSYIPSKSDLPKYDSIKLASIFGYLSSKFKATRESNTFKPNLRNSLSEANNDMFQYRTPRWLPGIGALFITFLSNPESLFVVLREGRSNFDTFWSSTRLFKSPAFTEYPIWAILHADLHAHLIAAPLSVLVVLGMTRLNEPFNISFQYIFSRVFLGATTAFLIATNLWDVITLSAVGVCLTLSVTLKVFATEKVSFAKLALNKIVDIIVISLIILTLSSPFLIHGLAGSTSIGSGYVYQEEFNNLSQMFNHFGIWFITIISLGGALFFTRAPVKQLKNRRLYLISLLAFLLFVFPTCIIFLDSLLFEKISGLNPFVLCLSIGLSLIAYRIWFGSVFEEREYFNSWFISGLLWSASIILIFAELRFVGDRMNTIFKFYSPLWWIFGIVATVLSYNVLRDRASAQNNENISISLIFLGLISIIMPCFFWESNGSYLLYLSTICATASFLIMIFSLLNNQLKIRRKIHQVGMPPLSISTFKNSLSTAPLLLVIIIQISLGAVGTVCNLYAITKIQRVSQPFSSLDGTAYLTKSFNQDWDISRWLNTNVKGVRGIVEAQGDPYQDYTHITMNTGLPTLLGWEHHTFQRGTSREDIIQRRRDISKIYSTNSPSEAAEIMRRYGLDFVIIGDVENRLYSNGRYNQAGRGKFDNSPELFKLVFRSGSSSIYQTAK